MNLTFIINLIQIFPLQFPFNLKFFHGLPYKLFNFLSNENKKRTIHFFNIQVLFINLRYLTLIYMCTCVRVCESSSKKATGSKTQPKVQTV